MAAALPERNGIAIIDNDSSRNKKRTRRTRCSCSFSQLLRPSNKNLFFVFLTTVVFVSISIVFVSVVYLDDGNSNGDDGVNYHSIVAQLGGKTKSSDKEVEALSSSFFLNNSSPYHTIFSTGCSIFQDWQSYVFFYHIFRSGQEGHVTRIVSGCDDKDTKDITKIFKDEIEPMRRNNDDATHINNNNNHHHHLHLTPDFSRVPKKSKGAFKYFNKPFGVRHWMEHALGYPDNHKLHDDSIIILMDPDQIMLRPFTNDFTNSSEKWKLNFPRYKTKVGHGSPFAQQYGYGLQWLDKVNPENVFRDSGRLPTPVSNLTRKEAFDYYMAMGPPYIVTAKDMYQIVTVWTDIVPRVYDEYPHLLAEMFGYNLAAAHLGLKHTVAHSFQVSDPWAGGEGWKLIDAVPKTNICKEFPKSQLPHVLHYCQKYYVGKWFISKYRLRKDFISCESPLLTPPPQDLPMRYTSGVSSEKFSKTEVIREWKPKELKEEAFMVCAMIDALNAASIFYKDQHCKDGTGNYNYSYTFHEDMRMPDEIA